MTTPRCDWCNKSVDGDYAADRGPGLPVLCYRCRTDLDNTTAGFSVTAEAGAVVTGDVLANGRRVVSASTGGNPQLMARTTFLRLDDGRTLMFDPSDVVALW